MKDGQGNKEVHSSSLCFSTVLARGQVVSGIIIFSTEDFMVIRGIGNGLDFQCGRAL